MPTSTSAKKTTSSKEKEDARKKAAEKAAAKKKAEEERKKKEEEEKKKKEGANAKTTTSSSAKDTFEDFEWNQEVFTAQQKKQAGQLDKLRAATDEGDSGLLKESFRLPQWGYDSYVKELDNFRKGLTGAGNDPGWFYFKIFFHFDDPFGLLGGILANENAASTAKNYLEIRENIFKYDNLSARKIALIKFVKYLNYINNNCPWFFDKVNGLQNIITKTTDFSKDKFIDISCIADAVDMRLTSLFHLYSYACYDDINMKEIIPANLRKFNMSIIIYHLPVRFYDNTLSTGETSRTLYGSNGKFNFSNRMSYKLFTLRGCEFDLNSLSNLTPSAMDNSQPFQLGKGNIRINYDRAFTHLMNSWEQFMIGSDGIYYSKNPQVGDQDDEQVQRINSLIRVINGTSNSKEDIIATDKLLGYAASTYTQKNLGNVYNINPVGYNAYLREKNNPNPSDSVTIYLSNLFDFNFLRYYKTVQRQLIINNRGLLPSLNASNNRSMISALQNNLDIYRSAWISVNTRDGNNNGTEDFATIWELEAHGAKVAMDEAMGLWGEPNFKDMLRSTINTWVSAWEDLSGRFETAENTWNNFKDDVYHSWRKLFPKKNT